jgi:hypothetical protein
MASSDSELSSDSDSNYFDGDDYGDDDRNYEKKIFGDL